MCGDDMIDWGLISTIVTVLIIPLLNWLLKCSEKKSEKREAAQAEFNKLLLEGIICVGDLSDANAEASLSGESESTIKKQKDCQKNYTDFRKQVDGFKTRQTVGTLQN